MEAHGMTFRMKPAMRPVQLLQLTDTHLFGDAAGEIYGVNTAATLAAVLADALRSGQPRPDAIVATGDIAEDESDAAYDRFREALSATGLPVYCLPGNHDAPASMAMMLDSDGFQFCGQARLGEWLIVMLDSHVPRNVRGRLSATELSRLETAIAQQAGRPTLIGVHHPPVRVGSRWLDRLGLQNADELFGAIDRHDQVRGVLCGHVHQACDTHRGPVRVMTTPSTCAQFLPGTEHCVMDQRPPGYRWLRLHADGTIQTEVVWLDGWRNAKPVRETHASQV
jgi:3',5'-cyclic-AMP phosphodiesterase